MLSIRLLSAIMCREDLGFRNTDGLGLISRIMI